MFWRSFPEKAALIWGMNQKKDLANPNLSLYSIPDFMGFYQYCNGPVVASKAGPTEDALYDGHSIDGF